MASRSVLILGSGSRIGKALSEKFAKNGYKVALVSRRGTDSIDEQGYLSLRADFADTDAGNLAGVFEKVVKEFKIAPSVVVYNAGSLTPPPDPSNALSIPSDRVIHDFNVNVVSPYIAAQEAIKNWSTLPKDEKKLFIYTGNICNVVVLPMPAMLNIGVEKAASAYWLGVADMAYASKGYRFIYADQRLENGALAGQTVDGPAHADFYEHLAMTGGQDIPWHCTFVKDKGYVDFSGKTG